ncbi:NAC domain-containing protein 74-like isoform X1 [Oryza brachyantha]|nr:NAC domain-containing protein 74-like isoform X1 [Oryza brachyantha]
MDSLRDIVLPPGFGFHPKDTELISHYLKKKVHGQQIEHDIIPVVDIYKHEPWDLPEKCNVPTQDNKWHFFAARDRKYPNGARSNRATVAGYWKSTGKDRTIKMGKRTIGTKKTLVFHEGRPPSGRRTEWIMHEYYIDERECQACPDMKDAFVLCRVTKREDWISGNGHELDNTDPPELNDDPTPVISPQQPDPAASSVVGTEQRNGEPTSVTVAESPEGVTSSAITADQASHTDGINIDEWLEELFDPSFNPEQDLASADLSRDEQNVESSNISALAPKVEQVYSSPNQNVADDTDYLLAEDLYNILNPGTDDFNMLQHPIDQEMLAFPCVYPSGALDPCDLANSLGNGTQKELWSPQDNSEPTQANEAADNGITIRNREGKIPTTSVPQYKGRRHAKIQVGINKMATSSSESINQTFTFESSSSCLVEHQKNREHDATTPSKRSDAVKPLCSNGGLLRSIRNAFTGCSEAGSNVILITVFAVGVAAVALHVGQRLGFRL